MKYGDDQLAIKDLSQTVKLVQIEVSADKPCFWVSSWLCLFKIFAATKVDDLVQKMEDNRFKFTNFKEVFGKLESAHPVRRDNFQNFGVPAILLGCVLFSFLMYIASEDWWTLPVCVLPFLILSVGVIWQIFSSRRDELRIYENGFTNRRGGKLQTCLWTEIKSYSHREQNLYELEELKNNELPLGSIEKKTGEIIVFDQNLPGTIEIIKRFENRKMKK